MRVKLHLLFVGLICTVAASAVADDWPRFRGTAGDGKSPETGLLSEWPEGGPNLVWEATGLGAGYSSVAVAGDRIYTLGDIDGKQNAFAISLETGELVWQQEIGDGNTGDFTGSRSTPTFDEGLLYCLTTEAVLVCLNADNGQVEWQSDLVEDFGAQIMLAKGKWEWRFSESPLVDGDRVIVTPGAADAMMVALDKKTGSEIWRSAIPNLGNRGMDGAGYCSAVISNACGVRQYVQLVGRGVIGVQADTGQFLWGYNRVANDVANISSAVVTGDKVFASTGYQTGSAGLHLTRADDGTFEAEEMYFLDHRKFQNHHGGFVGHDGYIYGGHGHKMGLPV